MASLVEMREISTDHLIRGITQERLMELDSKMQHDHKRESEVVVDIEEAGEEQIDVNEEEEQTFEEDLLLDSNSEKGMSESQGPPIPPKQLIEDEILDQETIHYSSREFQEMRQENQALREQLSDSYARLQQAEEIIAAKTFRGFQRDDVRRLRAQLQMYQSEYDKLAKSHDDTRRGVLYWQNAHKAVSEQWKLREAEIRQTQEGSIREMTDGRWNPVPDNILRDRFEELYKDVRAWAKTWAADYMHVEPEIVDDFVKNYLAQFVWYSKGHGLPDIITNSRSKLRDKIPMLLLTGALSHEIQTRFFENPFFCGNDSENEVEALKKTHAELLKANPREAHFWRSTWWRILNPPANSKEQAEGSEVEDISVTTFHRIRKFCDHVDSDFRKGYARLLLKPLEFNEEKADRARRLREILMTAAALAASLWTQRSSPCCMNIREIMSKDMLFNIRSPVLQAHPLHRLDDDDNDYDGKRVLMVVKPALLAFNEDDSEGLEGGGYRVLAKAVCLLED